jgi:hypothetical protein
MMGNSSGYGGGGGGSGIMGGGPRPLGGMGGGFASPSPRPYGGVTGMPSAGGPYWPTPTPGTPYPSPTPPQMPFPTPGWPSYPMPGPGPTMPGPGMPPSSPGGMGGLTDAQQVAAYKGGAPLPDNTSGFRDWINRTDYDGGGGQTHYDPYSGAMMGPDGNKLIGASSLGVQGLDNAAYWGSPGMLAAWKTTDPAVAKQRHMAALQPAAWLNRGTRMGNSSGYGGSGGGYGGGGYGGYGGGMSSGYGGYGGGGYGGNPMQSHNSGGWSPWGMQGGFGFSPWGMPQQQPQGGYQQQPVPVGGPAQPGQIGQMTGVTSPSDPNAPKPGQVLGTHQGGGPFAPMQGPNTTPAPGATPWLRPQRPWSPF